MPDSVIKSIDLLGLGLTVSDCSMLLPCYPSSNEKTVAVDTRRLVGGPVANAICCAARLGLRTAVHTVIGMDPEGDFVMNELARQGVDLRAVIRDPSIETPFAVIWIDERDGSRTVALGNRHSRNLDPDDLIAESILRSRAIILDGRGYETTLEAIEIASTGNTLTILDAGSSRIGMHEIIGKVDYAIFSRDCAESITGMHSPDKMLERLSRISRRLIITLGSEGSIGQDGDRVIRVPALSVKVVDSTGAGDIYHGAFAAALLGAFDSLNFEDCMRVASVAGSLACSGLGGQGHLPDRECIAQHWSSLHAKLGRAKELESMDGDE